MAHLNGAGDQNLVVNASVLTTCAATNPAFVHLDMLFCAATDSVLVRAHHSGAQLVKNLKSCLIPCDPKLALKLDSRHAWSLAGDQVGGPKPSGQGRVASLHDRANRQPSLTSAFAACQHAWAGRDVERDPGHPTMRTDKTVLPSNPFEIFSTGHIIREEPLKFWKRPRKRQRGVQIDVHHDSRRCIHSCVARSKQCPHLTRRMRACSGNAYEVATAGRCMCQPYRQGIRHNGLCRFWPILEALSAASLRVGRFS